jgi:hypothetical protein
MERMLEPFESRVHPACLLRQASSCVRSRQPGKPALPDLSLQRVFVAKTTKTSNRVCILHACAANSSERCVNIRAEPTHSVRDHLISEYS